MYLPGIHAIPPIDRDEARFAQASRQMFEAAALLPELQRPDFHDGGWAVPKVQDRPRLNKPPLIYWLQAASAWLFTAGEPLQDHVWMYRLPSVLGAVASVMLTWNLAARMLDPRAAWLAAAMLAVAPVVVFDAHQARADQVLLPCIVAAQAALWNLWSKPSRLNPLLASLAWPAVFWLATAASILAKGPIGPMVSALTILALCLARREWAWLARLRPGLGLVLVSLAIAPWVALVAGHVGWSTYLSIVYDETIGRSLSAKEGHWAPPGYHTLLLAVLFWPGSMLTALAIRRAWSLARPTRPIQEAQTVRPSMPTRLGAIRDWFRSLRIPFRGRDPELFCLAWIIPAWIVFEFVGTKLPHYTLPMYPAIAILTARCSLVLRPNTAADSFSRADRAGLALWWGLGLAMGIGLTLSLAAMLVLETGTAIRHATLLAAIILSVAVALAIWKWRPRREPEASPRRQIVMLLAWVAISGLFMTFVAPRVLPGSLTPALTAILRDAGLEGRSLASEYHEDSLIFATRGAVLRLDREHIADWLGQDPARVAIVRAKDPPFFAVESGQWSIQPSYRLMGTAARPFSRTWAIITREQPAEPRP